MSGRVGIFGGTFDPPHVGHLVAASQARHQLGLSSVTLMVANEPWQKLGERTLTPAAIRLELVTRAVDGHGGLRAGDAEIRRGGPTFTIDTLEELAVEQPGVEVVVILGADAASGLASWHRAEEVAAAATIAVLERPGAPVTAPMPGVRLERVAMPSLEISSSDLRGRCRRGEPVEFLVPDGVWSEMRRLHLYGLEA